MAGRVGGPQAGSWTSHGFFFAVVPLLFDLFIISNRLFKHLLLDVPSGSVTFDFFSFVMSFRLRHNRNHTVREIMFTISWELFASDWLPVLTDFI